MPTPLWSTSDQWSVLLPTALALLLATVIGLEREAGAEAAGLRTHDIDVVREGLDEDGDRVAAVTLHLDGRGDLSTLACRLTEPPGVHTAHTGAAEHD